MGGSGGSPRVRLAELVAALSLGVDLGFGQPMEHVLRQCLIALRLADHAGLDEQDRMAVYYTALLVNVGCHADAHEQAKWFGDDIALKSGKYVHELGSVRGTLATGHRLPRRREALSGLTAREVEVLILLARGLSNKQIAERLVITPKTAGNHVEHIYAKIGASSRAAAAMFAVQYGLLPEEKVAVTAEP